MSAATSPSLLLLFFFALSSGRSTQPVRQGGRRDGRASQAARMPRAGARASGAGSDRGGGNDLNAPHRAHLRPEQAAATGSTCPSRRTARGIGGNPPRAACGLDSKGRQAGVARTPSHQPLWGFPLSTALPAPVWKKEGARRRRVAPGKGGAGSRTGAEGEDHRRGPLHRQGRRLQPPLVGRRGGRPRRGREPDRSRDIYIAGNT
jgi:hypothetical protein